MKLLKNWLKTCLRRALALPAIDQALNKLREKQSQELFRISYWYEGNLWEPPVQIALRDLCKPGRVVFDVGANFGGLTTVMSRMVGPRGVVCAFEASPRIVDKCQRNIVLSGCSNVQVYHVAVYHSSNKRVPIYCGSHLNDSIYANSDTDVAAFNVPTLALDDFVNFTGLVPDLVKMDVEGAEYDALKGMLNTISKAKPYLILEQQPTDTRCLDLLREKGYKAIDLNTYREIRSSSDYPEGVGIRNNIYIHQDRLSENPYQLPFTLVETAILTENDFITSDNGSVCLKNCLSLSKGRYVIYLDFLAAGTSNEMMCGVKVSNSVIFRYHAYTKLLAQSYRDWVINLSETSEIQIYWDFINNTRDDSFSVKGGKIFRVAEFDELPSQLYI